MALLDELGGGLDGLGHAQARHDDGEAAAGKGADGDVVLDGGELGGGGEDAHVVELVEEELFVFAADGVFGGEEGEAMGELADGLFLKKGMLVLLKPAMEEKVWDKDSHRRVCCTCDSLQGSGSCSAV